MAILKCKMCGGNLDLIDDSTVVECEYCGTKQTVPNADNDKKMMMFERANKLRYTSEFDKAASIYESIVADFPYEAEAYWGLVLCKYGIEYVDDPATGNKIPTCHRSSFDSVMDDSDFEQVMENADPIARRVYRDEAKAIEDIRKGILEVSSKEEPYDIFICYKETDENGERTIDSVIAQDIYDSLTEKGYRVFFARISLEDKLGTAYEPYIFAALNSAKIMLAIGTDYEYYNAVWVKNEWSRFLALIAKGEKKTLIPCYKDIDAYDIPKEFKHLQAQDMGKVGAMQDLLRGIGKLLPKKKQAVVPQPVAVSSVTNETHPLLKRMFMYLEDGEWDKADEYSERVLDKDPEKAEAYLGKLMVDLKVCYRDDLKKQEQPFDNNKYYKKAFRFADEKTKGELNDDIATINNRILESKYTVAKKQAEQAKTSYGYFEAAALLKELGDYKDSAELAEKCIKTGEEKDREAAQKNYAIACSLQESDEERDLAEAALIFSSLKNFQDSSNRAVECNRTYKKKKAEREAREKVEREAHEKAAREAREAHEKAEREAREARREAREAREKAEREAREARERAEREAAQEKARQRRIELLNNEKSALKTELANLKGLFTGIRRKEIEARLAKIESAIKNLQQ